MSKILDAWRPVVQSPDQNGETNVASILAGLQVKVDKNEDGRVIGSCQVMFADFPGLEAEWVAQAGTTVLKAAVDTKINDIDFPTDQMATPQRTVFDEVLTPTA